MLLPGQRALLRGLALAAALLLAAPAGAASPGADDPIPLPAVVPGPGPGAVLSGPPLPPEDAPLVILLRPGAPGAVVAGYETGLEVAPALAGGRLLAPLRFLCEALGARTRWEAGAAAATCDTGGRTVTFAPGQPAARVDGWPLPLDAAPVIAGNRLLVPVRALGEALGARVWWDAATSTAGLEPQPAPSAAPAFERAEARAWLLRALARLAAGRPEQVHPQVRALLPAGARLVTFLITDAYTYGPGQVVLRARVVLQPSGGAWSGRADLLVRLERQPSGWAPGVAHLLPRERAELDPRAPDRAVVTVSAAESVAVSARRLPRAARPLDGQPGRLLELGRERVTAVSLHPTATRIAFATAGPGPALAAFDWSTGQVLVADLLPAPATSLAWSPDGRHLLVDGAVVDLQRGRRLPLPAGQVPLGWTAPGRAVLPSGALWRL